MLRRTSWFWLSLILAGWLVAVPPAQAQKKDQRSDPARKVNDEAGLFGKDAIRTANEEIAQIKSAYKKDVLIETRETGPEKSKFEAWAEEQAKSHRVEGIYIVITKEPNLPKRAAATGHFEILVGNATLRKGTFTTDDRTAVRDILKKGLGKQPDEALLKAVRYIRNAMRDNTAGKVGAAPVTAPAKEPFPDRDEPAPAQQKHGFSLFGLGLGGLICVGIVGLVVVWLLFGLIRALTNRGAGAPGYGGGGGGGPGYGGGYGGGGGGGGGFMSSLFGGMFGAAAGMWAYNNLFGGHSTPSVGAQGPVGGGDYGSTTPEPTDVGSGYSGSGGDYGGDKDVGGGDKDVGGDAGGGDWGGGGDAGGGDAGGGGDWGGGGGGDFGGGGGDFGGGGGGGGDW